MGTTLVMINPFYFTESFVDSFSSAFRARESATFEATGASVSSAVYPVALWPEFLMAEDCEALRNELAKLPFQLRSSDLYEFHQTIDLKHLSPADNPLISGLCAELYSDKFLEVMQKVTGRKLGRHVDISGQRYAKGDFLLCHDDRLEKRRIALILYLVERGGQLEGGKLWALRSDEEGRPIMQNPQTFTPQYNTLAFFEVSRISFHQVEQVLSQNLPRFSITCWFHDDDDEEEGGENNQENSMQEILPIKFKYSFDLNDLLSGLSVSRQIYRNYFNGQCISLADYSFQLEPRWMAQLLNDSFHRRLEKITGCLLDWPTRPVVWILSDHEDHFYDERAFIDHHQDFEYNYKTRKASEPTNDIKDKYLHFYLIVRYKGDAPLTPYVKLQTQPLSVPKLPKRYKKLVIVAMRFNKSNRNDRYGL